MRRNITIYSLHANDLHFYFTKFNHLSVEKLPNILKISNLFRKLPPAENVALFANRAQFF